MKVVVQVNLKDKMKIFKMVGNYLIGFICILLLILVFLSSVNNDRKLPKIGNHSILIVEGTSMHPLIKNGDLIVINRSIKKEYKINDIVSFTSSDGSIITHQIMDIEKNGDEYQYFTKGINNNYQDNDYISNNQIIGEYKGFRIPLLGYVMGFASTRIGYLLLVVIPLGLVVLLVIRELIKEVSKKKGEV